MEGQRDGALEDPGRPWELALIPVGGEPVERVGADLRLDALFAEGRDLVRGAVDLDHVGLKAVDVSLVGRRRLDELLEARTRIAAGYTERLRDVVETPKVDDGDVHGWQAYVIRVDGAADKIAALRERGIEAQVGTYALHRLAAYRDQGEFPGASQVFDCAIALPFHTRLTSSDLDRVAEAVTELAG